MNKEYIEFIESFSDNVFIIKYEHNNIIKFELISKKSIYAINYENTNNKIVIIEPNNTLNTLNNTLLYNIIKHTKYDDIFDMIIDIKQLLPSITSYCVGCYKKLEFQSDEYITCGNKECDYIFDELKTGNPVMDKVKEDKHMVRFLIESGIDAIMCDRKYDIFEPFPSYFLKDNDQNNLLIKDFRGQTRGQLSQQSNLLTRGQMSKLSGVNYDDKKDFAKLSDIVAKFNIDDFFEFTIVCYDDEELIKYLGQDCYQLIRFIVRSSKIELVKDDALLNNMLNNNNINVYKIVHSVEKENEFKKLSNNEHSYLFHGSRWHNWYSILRNGLKNCSNSKLMTAGAAYGPGIYLSSDFSYSAGYGCSSYNFNKNTATKATTATNSRPSVDNATKVTTVVGVFEVANKSNYATSTTSTNSIYVVNDEKMLIQRYLIIMPRTMTQNVTLEINKLFSSDIIVEKKKTQKIIMTKGLNKLVREYKRLIRLKDTYGFKIEIAPKNMYIWKIYLFGYDKNEPLGQDMVKYNIEHIEIEVTFPQNYPFSPPFLRVISPRFKCLTGHVTSAGALCMQILTEKHWDPACSMESLIITIKSEILEGGGRLDPHNYNLPYTQNEAIESFNRVSRGHGWQ
jgi:ubiquitin-protein ligase